MHRQIANYSIFKPIATDNSNSINSVTENIAADVAPQVFDYLQPKKISEPVLESGEAIYCVKQLANGNIIAGHGDGRISCCNLKTRESFSIESGHGIPNNSDLIRTPVTQLVELTNGWVVSISSGVTAGSYNHRFSDGLISPQLHVWDMNTKQRLATLTHQKLLRSPDCIIALPNNQLLAAFWSTYICWDMTTGKTLYFVGYDKNITCMTLLTDNRLATGHSDGTVCVLDLKEIPFLEMGTKCMEGYCYMHYGNGLDPIEKLHSQNTTSPVRCIASLLGNCIITGHEDGKVHMWSTHLNNLSGWREDYWQSPLNTINCITVLPNEHLAIGKNIGIIYVLDLKSKHTTSVNSFWASHQPIKAIELLDDERLITGSGGYEQTFQNKGGELRIWSFASATLEQENIDNLNMHKIHKKLD